MLSSHVNQKDPTKNPKTPFVNMQSELPSLNLVEITTGFKGTTLHQNDGILEQSNRMHDKNLSTNDQQMDNNKKYDGRDIHDSRFTNTSLTDDDIGNYSSRVNNAVGSVSKNVILGAPRMENVEEIENQWKKSMSTHCQVLQSIEIKDNKSSKSKDVHVDQNKVTIVSFPHPVLFVRQGDQLEEKDITSFFRKVVLLISGYQIPTVIREKEHMESTLNKDNVAEIRFTHLMNILTKQFSHQKVECPKHVLIAFGNLEHPSFTLEQKSALEYLRIIQEGNCFTRTTVTFMQFLNTEADCLELKSKCKTYAKGQKCKFYFIAKPSDNGYKDVQFHVQVQRFLFTKEGICHIIKTITAILDCQEEDILPIGARNSLSDSFTLDPVYSLQDVVRCHLCETPMPPLHCELCDIHLCSVCENTHLTDKLTEHKVVPFKLRGRLTKCEKHFSKIRDRYCEQCNFNICENCASSREHSGHKLIDVVKQFERNEKSLQKDLQDLEKSMFPKYREIEYITQVQIADMKENSRKLTTAIDKYGEDLHGEIDIDFRKFKYEHGAIDSKYMTVLLKQEYNTTQNIPQKLKETIMEYEENLHKNIDTCINRLKSDLDEMGSKHLSVLNEQKNKVTDIISDIKCNIADLKELQNSVNVSVICTYKSRNAQFRKLPPKITQTLPIFTPQKINKEQIYQVGTLSSSSIKTEVHGYTMN